MTTESAGRSMNLENGASMRSTATPGIYERHLYERLECRRICKKKPTGLVVT
jgi:hypothetical protein